MKSKGFTIIELLMVVSIIILLMAILLPALKKSRESAKTITCASNMKQCGLLFGMYAGDNSDSLIPNHLEGWGGAAGVYPWSQTLYMEGYWNQRTNIVRCPSVQKDTALAGSYAEYSTYGTFLRNPGLKIYRFNQLYSYWPDSAKCFILIDSVRKASGATYDYESFGADAATNLKGIQLRHARTANALFPDGHVQRLTFTDISSTTGSVNNYGGHRAPQFGNQYIYY